MKEIGTVIKEILNNIGDGILFLDRDYKILFANKAVLQLYRQKEEDVIGKKCHSFSHQYPVPCHKKGTSVICPHQEVFKTGKTISTIHTHTLPDGTEKIFDITASAFRDEKGDVIQVIEILRDVTEKRRVEKVLRESEEKYRAFFEQAADSIVLIDAETGALVEFNSKAYENLGYSRKEFQKLKIPDFEVIESAEEVTKHIKKIIKKGVDVFETKHRRKDGQIRNILVSSRAISVGGKSFAQSIWSDITERKQMEEELRCYGERLRILCEIDHAILTAQSIKKIVRVALGHIRELVPVQLASLALFDFDADEVTVFAAHTTGKTKVGTGVRFSLKDYWVAEETLKGKIHVVEDISSISQLSPVEKKLQAEGLRAYINIPLIFHDEIIGSLNLGKNTPGAFAPEDVTITSEVADILAVAIRSKQAEEALRESEERFRQLSDAAFEGIAITEKGKLLDVSKGFATMFGYKHSEVIGMHVSKLVAPKYRDFVMQKILSGYEKPFEAKGVKKNGELFSVEVCGKSIHYKGSIARVTALRDITERKQMEETLRKRAEQVINYQMALLKLAKMDNSNLDTALKRITEVDSKTLGVERVSVWLFDEDRSEIICKDLYKLSKNLHEKGLRLHAKNYPKYFHALKENRTIAADDARTDLRTNEFTEEYLKPFGITSMMDVPIWLHGEVAGIVCHEHTGQRRKWTLEEQEFAASIADIVSLALEASKRKQAEEELKAAIIRIEEEKTKSEAIISSIGDALNIVDTNYVIKYQNQASKNLLGDHIGELCYKAYKGIEQVCEGCPVAASLKDGKIHRVQRSWFTDKGITYLEVTASPLRDSTEKTIGGIEVVRDITERKWMEKTLQEEKNKLQSIIEAMEYGLTIQDRDYNIIYQNKILKKTFGRLGEKCYRVYESKDRVCDGCPVEMAYRDGRSHTSERHVTMPSGESACWENTANPIRNAEGEVVACLEIARNITERKRVEEMLKESEKKYRDLVDNALIGVYKTNLKGDIIYANEALSNIFEFESPEEMMQSGVLPRYKNPEDREVLIEKLKKTGKVSDFEFEVLTKTRKPKNVLLSATLEGDTISGMIMDVTEQRHTEKALRESGIFLSSIFEGIQDGVVVLDRDFRILFANSSYIEQIGSSSNEVKGKHCYKVSYNRDEPCYSAGLECSVKNVFETGLSSRETRKKDNKYMEMTVYPLKDCSGNVVSVVEIRRDVTRNVQLDEELKKKIRELEKFYDLAVGRELKMIELKEEIKKLKEELKKHN